MQAELKLAKERLRRKSVILARQEEEIAARGRAIDTAAVDAQALQHATEMAQQDADARKVGLLYLTSSCMCWLPTGDFRVAQSMAAVTQAECADLREKLQEAKEQQRSQEDMIRWLNNQVLLLSLLRVQRGI